MSRILSQTLIHGTSARYLSYSSLRYGSLRFQSNGPNKNAVELIEVDIGPDSDDSGSESDMNERKLRMFREALQAVIIRRAAPDWIPFVPGSSYLIPPPPKTNSEILTSEEELSLQCAGGWPSFSFFAQGVFPQHVDDTSEKPSPKPDIE